MDKVQQRLYFDTVVDIVFDSSQPTETKKVAQELARLLCLNMIDHPELDLTPNEVQILADEGKIACIKAYRRRTGLGLQESKDQVELQAKRKGYIIRPSVY